MSSPVELAAGIEGAALSDAYGLACLDVPVAAWVETVRRARDELGCTFFDWLSAVDELAAGFRVVVHLANLMDHHHLLIRTLVPRERARLDSLTPLFAGAGWHERETAEMFGLDFAGHPGLAPLLLPDGFEGHPLRKEFVLAARAAKVWPGAKDPGESDSDAPSTRRRRRNTAPGVPEPGTWGPGAQ